MSKATVKAPVEKLPLAVRKNVRDEYESKKAGLEEELSQKLGTSWKIDINPGAIYAYTEEGSYGHNNLGECLRTYVEGAIRGIDEFLSGSGDVGKDEINKLAHAHTLAMEMDVDKTISHSGSEIRDDGKLYILFGDSSLGSNINYSMDKLAETLNNAPKPAGAPALSIIARLSIRKDFDGKYNIDSVQESLAKELHNDSIKLNPNFEASFTKLKEAKGTVRDDFETQFGQLMFYYFKGLISTFEGNNFGSDEMLYEGFAEAVPKGEICFRVVDKLVKGTYNECVIEDGVFYIQTLAEHFGTNVNDIASKVVDLL